jgi:hypothetical protein
MSHETHQSNTYRAHLRCLFHSGDGKHDDDEADVAESRAADSVTASKVEVIPSGTFIEKWTIAPREGARWSVQCDLDCSLPHHVISHGELASVVRRTALIEQHIRAKSLPNVEKTMEGLASWGYSALAVGTFKEAVKSQIEEESERWRKRRDQFASSLGDIAFHMADKPVIDWKTDKVQTDARGVTTTVRDLTLIAENRDE